MALRLERGVQFGGKMQAGGRGRCCDAFRGVCVNGLVVCVVEISVVAGRLLVALNVRGKGDYSDFSLKSTTPPRPKVSKRTAALPSESFDNTVASNIPSIPKVAPGCRRFPGLSMQSHSSEPFSGLSKRHSTSPPVGFLQNSRL